MSPEELDEARAKEAVRQFGEPADRHILAADRELARIAARLAREGWTPPEPPEPPVGPDLLAFREWYSAQQVGPAFKEHVLAGSYDNTEASRAYLAGARMATERERERAKVLLEYMRLNTKWDVGAGVIVKTYEEGQS